jgi:hypothetical protein
MPKKSAAKPLPAHTCDFAIIEFKKGRKALEKLVADGRKIKFTITGYLQPGSQSIGHDDGVSTPFWADVEKIALA